MTKPQKEPQKQDALVRMGQWLAGQDKQGKPPAILHIVGEIVLYKKRYYMIKFKKNRLNRQWNFGICGGYEGDSMLHCGHVLSLMREYNPATARKQAAEMIELLHDRWIEKAFEEIDRKALMAEEIKNRA